MKILILAAIATAASAGTNQTSDCSTVTCPAGEVCEYIQNANGVFTECVPSKPATPPTTGTNPGRPADCSTMTCPSGEICKYIQTAAGVSANCVPSDVTEPVTTPCDDETNSVLCGAGGICKEGYSCSGCQQRCKCDSNGVKVCDQMCRPTCEKIEERTDCLNEPVSMWSSLGCSPFSCYDDSVSLSDEKMKYCCDRTGRYCKEDSKDLFDCRINPTTMSFDQRKWCCEQKQVGCPVAQYDCSVDDSSVQVMKNADGLMQTSIASVMWDDKKAAYCCDKFQIGCPVDVDVFDCDWSSTTAAVWSGEQSKWCCSVKGIRCPDVTPVVVVEEKCQAKKEVRDMWDEATRKECCLSEGIGCASEKYDCYGDEKKMSEWSTEQTEWCCDEENIACKVDCRAEADLLSEQERKECCNSKGLHCEKSTTDDVESKKEKYNNKKTFRLSFKSKYSKIMENPKRFLRKLRATLLKVTKGLKPSNLMINFVGGLMKDSIVPPQDSYSRWGTSIPSSWNTELVAGETSSERGIETLGHGVSSTKEQLAIGDEGSFVEFEIGSDEGTTVDTGADLLQGAVSESRVGGGTLRDNNDGSTLILEPVGEGIKVLSSTSEEEPTKDDDNNSEKKTDEDDSNNTLLYGIIAAVSTLCLGGALVALTMYRKRQNQLNNEDFIESMQVIEENQQPVASNKVSTVVKI